MKKEKMFENMGLSKEIKTKLQEAWDKKLEQAKIEVREEFASKYSHDRSEIVESMNSMINDTAKSEAVRLAEERKKLIKSRLELKENISGFKKFVAKKLSEEVAQLHADRKILESNVEKFTKFFVKQVTPVLREYKEENDRLISTRVSLLKEGRKAIVKEKRSMTKKLSVAAEKWLKETVSKEFNEYRQDLVEARKNHFGQRIFETIKSEFETKYFEKNKFAKKLKESKEAVKSKLDSAYKLIKEQNTLLKGKEVMLKNSQSKMRREKIISESISHLPTDKKVVMMEMIKGVNDAQLERKIKQYLPIVLENKSSKVFDSKRSKRLMEKNNGRRVMTGKKKMPTKLLRENIDSESNKEMNDIYRLAGV